MLQFWHYLVLKELSETRGGIWVLQIREKMLDWAANKFATPSPVKTKQNTNTLSCNKVSTNVF